MVLLQDHASSLLFLLLWWRSNDSSDGFIENVLQSLLGQSRAFEVLHGIDFLSFGHSLLVGNWCQSLLSQSFDSFAIVSKIQLCSNEDDWSVWAMVAYFRVPLGRNVFEG